MDTGPTLQHIELELFGPFVAVRDVTPSGL